MEEFEVLRGQEWHRVISFQASAEVIEAWETASFGGPIERVAHEDDHPRYVEHVGEGVQKAGDRATSGAEGSAQFAVVITQDDEPIVHIGVIKVN